MIDKERAIDKLNQQINFIPELKKKERFSMEFKKWQRDTQVSIQKIFSDESEHVSDFKKIHFSLPIMTNFTTELDIQESFHGGLDSAMSLINSFIDEINEYWEDIPIATSGIKDCLTIIEKMCNRFHFVAKQLRSRYDGRTAFTIQDEYDVQDLLHAILGLEFDDIRPEEWTPSYAGKSSRVDFLLKQEDAVIEVKKTRDRLGTKEVGEQLIIDIERYRAHPNCKILVCFVYDPDEKINNPRGLENDLSGVREGLTVKVIIAPKFS
jgi:REase_DpnII-MboI